MANVIKGLKELLPYARNDFIAIPCSKMLPFMWKECPHCKTANGDYTDPKIKLGTKIAIAH